MGLTLKEKEEIKHKVAQGYDGTAERTRTMLDEVNKTTLAALKKEEQKPLPDAVRSPASAVTADELIIEVTGNDGLASVTMRPGEVSRLRGRFGRGPGFEKWVAARIRDGLISFGGG